jgi:energy-coupling factor transport system ATP-binding protein
VTQLRAEGLRFAYPDGTRALDGVDLSIGAGEAVAVVGHNGSGKSTLARHFNGLLRPTAGRILIDGSDIASTRVAHLAQMVGMVFQNPDRQIFAGRVRDEVAFGPRMLGRSHREVAEAVGAALEDVGLTGVADRNPYDLGYSQRKLLAVASILAMEPSVVILDEPTTGQDARGSDRIRRLIGDLQAGGRTVIAISHDMRFVAETFGRVVVLGSGRILLDGPPETVFDAAAWPILAQSAIEPPYAARVGARLGLASTPTDDALVDGLAMRAASG